MERSASVILLPSICSTVTRLVTSGKRRCVDAVAFCVYIVCSLSPSHLGKRQGEMHTHFYRSFVLFSHKPRSHLLVRKHRQSELKTDTERCSSSAQLPIPSLYSLCSKARLCGEYNPFCGRISLDRHWSVECPPLTLRSERGLPDLKHT